LHPSFQVLSQLFDRVKGRLIKKYIKKDKKHEKKGKTKDNSDHLAYWLPYALL
jgi:hypothetical protein